MKKRALAAVLWFYAGWYAGNLIAAVVAVPDVFGPILGVAAAGLFAWDPRGIFWRHAPTPTATPQTATA